MQANVQWDYSLQVMCNNNTSGNNVISPHRAWPKCGLPLCWVFHAAIPTPVTCHFLHAFPSWDRQPHGQTDNVGQMLYAMHVGSHRSKFEICMILERSWYQEYISNRFALQHCQKNSSICLVTSEQFTHEFNENSIVLHIC